LLTAWLIAEAVTSRSFAARVKLLCRATPSKAESSESSVARIIEFSSLPFLKLAF
jgi:hypothetical protein